MQYKISKKRKAGFTLLEIMLVVVIIGILAGTIAIRVVPRIAFAKQKRAEADIATLSNSLEEYYMHAGEYPTTEQGLRALIEKPTIPPIPKVWRGPYIRKLKNDPWGEPYRYKCPGDHNPDSFDLWSAGKDRQDGTSDDITNWSTEEEKESTQE